MPKPFPPIAAIAHCVLLASFFGLCLAALPSRGEPAHTQDFNGQESVWQLLNTDVQGRLVTHERAPGGARDNASLERVVVAAGNGQSVMLACPVADAAVIDELEIRIWVKSSRPGVQLAARVVMPRSRDPNNRSTVTAIVRGTTYDRPGYWQQLVINDLPKLLAAQVRVMRTMPGASIDPREAFIDSAVLVVPGEPNGVETLTDELVVDGIVRPATDSVELASFPSGSLATSPESAMSPLRLADDMRSIRGIANSGHGLTPSPVRLQGTALLVDGRPFLPRAIQWQGERLEFLATLGFNVVLLDKPPTPEQIANAARLPLWFICAAPRPDALSRDGLGEPGDHVIAWCLEDDSLETDHQYAGRWAELVRERDAVAGRPVVIVPESNWTTASKTADILLARHPRAVSVDGAEFDRWLSSRTPAARPGALLWTSYATQFDELVGRQASALAGITLAPPVVDARQLDSLVRVACTHGVRGFVFTSHSPLSETDAVTRHRAATLALINRRLQMIEPWLSAGKVTGRVSSTDAGWTGTVLHVDHARLLIPTADLAASAGPKPTSVAAGETVFVVPGVPDSCQLFALSPAGMRTLPTQRVAGGKRFSMRPENDDCVLMTEDPQAVQTLRQRIAVDGAVYVRLQRERASLRAMYLADLARRLAPLGHNTDAAAQTSAKTQSQLRTIDTLLVSGRIEQANQLVTLANQAIELALDKQRGELGLQTNLQSNPLAVSDGQLAEYAAFLPSFAALHGSENLLYGGDFEDLGQMTQFGWRHFGSPQTNADSRADLSAVEPQHGRYCLQLQNSDASVGGATDVHAAPLWIQSPPMPVTTGQWIEITGWVRIDEPIVDTDRGLHIIDSLGGPQLALAIRQTPGWQPFQMIRAASESSELRLTIALTGTGTAKLDAVMVRAIGTPTPRRLPATDPFDNSSPKTGAADTSGPLFIAPQTR